MFDGHPFVSHKLPNTQNSDMASHYFPERKYAYYNEYRSEALRVLTERNFCLTLTLAI